MRHCLSVSRFSVTACPLIVILAEALKALQAMNHRRLPTEHFGEDELLIPSRGRADREKIDKVVDKIEAIQALANTRRVVSPWIGTIDLGPRRHTTVDRFACLGGHRCDQPAAVSVTCC